MGTNQHTRRMVTMPTIIQIENRLFRDIWDQLEVSFVFIFLLISFFFFFSFLSFFIPFVCLFGFFFPILGIAVPQVSMAVTVLDISGF